MRHSPFTVVYDACVLYPAPLRDFLMWLALSGAFRARWSTQIHDEWKRSLLENRPDLTSEQIDRTIFTMNDAVPGAVVTEYEFLIEGLVPAATNPRHPRRGFFTSNSHCGLVAALRRGLTGEATDPKRTDTGNAPESGRAE